MNVEELAKILKMFSEEKEKEAYNANSEWVQGYCRGSASAYKLSAQWINEIIEKGEIN